MSEWQCHLLSCQVTAKKKVWRESSQRRFDILQYLVILLLPIRIPSNPSLPLIAPRCNIHPYRWSGAIEDFIRLWRLLGLFCVLVQAYHLHRLRAHHGSLHHFKAFAKTERRRSSFDSPKVAAGQVTKNEPLSSVVKTQMTPCMKMTFFYTQKRRNSVPKLKFLCFSLFTEGLEAVKTTLWAF